MRPLDLVLGLVANQARRLRMRRVVECRSARRTAGRPSTRRAARHLTAKPVARRPSTRRAARFLTAKPAARRPSTRRAARFLTAKPTARRPRTTRATALTTLARRGDQARQPLKRAAPHYLAACRTDGGLYFACMGPSTLDNVSSTKLREP